MVPDGGPHEQLLFFVPLLQLVFLILDQQFGQEQSMPFCPEKSVQVSYGTGHTESPMHSHVGLPSQPFGMPTQWLAGPSLVCASMVTQVCNGPVQSLQPETLAHSVAGTHGPQQLSLMLGTSPGSHTGGFELQMISDVHGMPATQLPAVHATSACVTPSDAHMSMMQSTGHSGTFSPGPIA